MRPAVLPPSRRRALLLVLTLAVAAACGPFRRESLEEQTVVTFVNESTRQVDLFAVTPSGSIRLATVGPNRTEDIRLNASVVGAGSSGINFVARVFPNRAAVESGMVTIIRGDRFTVRLPPSLNFLVVTPS